MKWISVKNKLPCNIEDMCKHDYVFVLGEGDLGEGMISIAQFRDGKWDFMNNEGIAAYSCVGIGTLTSENISHWCRLTYPFVPDKFEYM